MADSYVSDLQVAARYGVHRATPWRWLRSRNFPKPIQLTPGCTRWKLSEIEAWEAARAESSK
ncbi:helix-turn-helix transcriptional regulator [Albidovulum sediminicola]|uniref:AlpA family phage regulatory protein n=1 Tax=Albidovulum sediminicola TaxID=2984331 RepID=A0ABT2Z704_9RHOB|nr:AlpA family phage regulatory protein [Defluviimonas sp. WL0075]MCV2866914.1 AlpA family phage regulatory protein [Defluviimonas sp. WL0075]